MNIVAWSRCLGKTTSRPHDDFSFAPEGPPPLGAVHVVRGMLKLVIDPASPYYNTILGAAKTFILYCASGGRSALAAQRVQEMGFERVTHLGGGLKAWKEAGYGLDPYQKP